MSLPAYMYLYDENGMLIDGGCTALGRAGAIEVMSSSYGVSQPADSNTGSMTGSRQHSPYIFHKQIDKVSPFLAVSVCEGRRLQKAEIKYYETNEAGVEYEVYRVTLESIIIMSINANHTFIPGSNSPNMLESVAIRYKSIEWFYLDGMIKYSDSWMRKEKQKQ